MAAADTRRAFQLFHAVLGLGLFAISLITLWHTLHELGEPGHRHLAFVAAIEAVGALLFLIPRTIRWGGAVLLLVLLPAFVNHLIRGDWEFQLLIYAAGVWYVMVHGAAWSARPPVSDVAA